MNGRQERAWKSESDPRRASYQVQPAVAYTEAAESEGASSGAKPRLALRTDP